MTKEAAHKFGSMYQYGVEYMQNFNSDAEEFLDMYNLYKNDIYENGFSENWENWKENNQALIIRLYDALDQADLIPNN